MHRWDIFNIPSFYVFLIFKSKNMKNIIQINNCYKKYRNKEVFALDNINVNITTGDIIGILGPNGAGKSTLIKCILGTLSPTKGSILFWDKNPMDFNNNDKKKIGVYFGGKSNLIYLLPVYDSIKLNAEIYGLDKKSFCYNIKFYSKLLNCENFLQQRVATLSLGQKVKAELLSILIYSPEIIILDEPTLGLDIEGKKQIRDILKNLSKINGITVIVTTHDINDVNKYCNKILFINNGKSLFYKSNKDFIELISKNIIINTNISINDSNTVKKIDSYNNIYRYLVPSARESQILDSIRNDPELKVLNIENATLEDILYEYYK